MCLSADSQNNSETMQKVARLWANDLLQMKAGGQVKNSKIKTLLRKAVGKGNRSFINNVAYFLIDDEIRSIGYAGVTPVLVISGDWIAPIVCFDKGTYTASEVRSHINAYVDEWVIRRKVGV
jgi:hypothetical protein